MWIVRQPSRLSLLILGGVFGAPALAADYRSVAPILERHCVTCHRAGEIGPMPLTTYRQVRPWAKAIREAVQLGRMPPWFVHAASVAFANDARLPEADRAALIDWVNAGAAEGPRAAPAKPASSRPPARPQAHPPSLILQPGQPFRVAPGDVVDYQYLILAVPGPPRDRWVTRIAIRPSARAVVHHIVAYVRERDNEWLKASPRGVMHVPPPADRQTKADILAVYTPGARDVILPGGLAKKLPAGAEVVLQFHYTPSRRLELDRTAIELNFAPSPPRQRVLTLQMGVDDLEIPPGDRGYRRSVSGTLPQDALLLNLMPHMHLRGSEFAFEIVGDGGRVETLLRVKPFDFYWQLTYWLAQPRLLPKGTRLRFTGTFDNSAANRRNPDPGATVRWGEQSWQEMMIGFFDVAVDPGLDKAAFFTR